MFVVTLRDIIGFILLGVLAVVMVVGFICVIISNHVKRRKKRK